MQVSNDLIENIGQDEIKRYLRKKGITENRAGVDFQHWLADLLDRKIDRSDFEDFCYRSLMYGKRKLIRSYEIGNTRELRDENHWLKILKSEFHITSLNFNSILTTTLHPGEEWKLAAVKTTDDEKGDLKNISILFQCYVCKTGNIESCTYIPVEIDLKNKIFLIKAWGRQGLDGEKEYKFNYLMDKVFEWLCNRGKLKIGTPQFDYRTTLANMNESLIEELVESIPLSRELELIKGYFPPIEAWILEKVDFESKYIDGGQTKIPKSVMNIQNEINNLITRAIVSDFFFRRNYNAVWDMGLSAVVNSVKLSELDNAITIVKSEDNNKPVFCGKPFLMLLGAMENTRQVDALCISFMYRDKKFRVSYDATKEDCISIGILSGQEDFCEEDYQMIWEMLKKYEKGKVVSNKTVVGTAIGQ